MEISINRTQTSGFAHCDYHNVHFFGNPWWVLPCYLNSLKFLICSLVAFSLPWYKDLYAHLTTAKTFPGVASQCIYVSANLCKSFSSSLLPAHAYQCYCLPWQLFPQYPLVQVSQNFTIIAIYPAVLYINVYLTLEPEGLNRENLCALCTRIT